MAYTSNIPALLLRQGDIEAQRQQTRAGAWSQGIGSIANLASGAISTYAKQRDEAPFRDAALATANETTQKAKHAEDIRAAVNRHQGDYLAAADDLTSGGNAVAGKALRDEYQKTLDDQLAHVNERIATHQDAFGQIVQMGTELQRNQDPAMYQQMVPQLKGLFQRVDPSGELANQVPDAYPGADHIQALMQAASTGAQEADKANGAIKKIQAATDRQIGVAKLLEGATSADDWTARAQTALAAGAPRSMVESFGDFTPENVAKAHTATMTQAEREKAKKDQDDSDLKWYEANIKERALNAKPEGAGVNSLAAATAAYAAKKGVPVEQLTYDDLIKVTRDKNFSPPHATATGPNGQALAGNWDLTGEDFLATIPPQDRLTVKKIANYEEDPTKIASMRGDRRETIMRYVNNVNPDYNGAEFANIAPTRKAFTTGAQGKQINAINTAIGHIDQLVSLADKLQPGTLMPANKAWNAIRTTFGSDRVTNFDTLKDALSGEVAGVLSQNGATVSSIADAKAHISAASSPEQLAGYVRTQIPILGSKLASLDYQYHQAAHDENFSALSPMTKSILVKHGFNPDHPTIDQGAAAAPAAPAAAPRVGERRTINGQQAEWQTINGQRGWVAVP